MTNKELLDKIRDEILHLKMKERQRTNGINTGADVYLSSYAVLSILSNALTEESEDERIRKEMIAYFAHRADVTEFIDEGEDCKRWIAHLEKQKEQKPIKMEVYEIGKGTTICGQDYKCKKDYKEGNCWYIKDVIYHCSRDGYLNDQNGVSWSCTPEWFKEYIQSNTEWAEEEKTRFVSGQFLQCKLSFDEFKEGEHYWLEYVGDDMYVGRSDNILNQRFHITPRQLYTLFSQKLEEVQGPPQEEKQVSLNYEPPFDENPSDKEIIEALIHHLNEQNGFLTAINCVSTKAILNWLKKQKEQKPIDYPYLPGWRKNRDNNKPELKRSVLMLTTHGVAEGEWLGEKWCQYRWSCELKDGEVLYWIHLSDLERLEKEGEEKQKEQKPMDKIDLKFNIGDTIVNKKNGEKCTISNRCLLHQYYSDTNHCHEIKFDEQDDWELVEQKEQDKCLEYCVRSHCIGCSIYEKEKEKWPIMDVFGFKVGDAVRLKDGDGRKHIIKSFEEVEGVHGPNFYHVEFEDTSARDGIYLGEEYPNGYYIQMEKLEEVQGPPQEEKQVSLTHEPPFDENPSDKEIIEALIKHLKEQDGFLTAIDCVSTKAILSWLEKQKEPEWSDIDREMLDRIIERGCCELPPRTRALTSDMVQWLQWMKEGRIAPKPAECIEDSVKFEEGFKTGRESGLRDGQKYVLDNAESYGLCKPAEWSEEDENMLNSCISSIEEAKENRYAYKETDGDTSYDHEIAWLKSLRPSWKPSDQDELMKLKYAGTSTKLD